MEDAVNLVAEAELSDGKLAVVEDYLNKDVFHVYKKDKNVQPNHDAKGVMRYLMHVIHALGYRANKTELQLAEEKAKIVKLERMVSLLEQLSKAFNSLRMHNNEVTGIGNWMLTCNTDGTNLYRHKDDEKDKWRSARSVQEILNVIYEKEFQNG